MSTGVPGNPPAARAGKMQAKASELTLHQLRIFWAVAHSDTLTRAAKQLGLAQPSLSQQLGKLEAKVGTLLFHRRSSEMELTEAGEYLLPRVEQLLRLLTDVEDGLAQFRGGERVTLRVAGINSVLRTFVPEAVEAMLRQHPGLEFDLQESSPAEILDLLYSRRVNIGLLATNSVAEASVGFVQVPLIEDPHVLVVPESLVLDDITDPERQLSPEQWTTLNRSVQFIFASQQAQRVTAWYDTLLPQHHVVAKCRSYDTAIGLVRASAGVCLAPGLATVQQNATPGVRLYRVRATARTIVALVPSQYRQAEPYAALLDVLQTIARRHTLPHLRPTPPFLALELTGEL